MAATDAHRAIEAVFRIEAPRLIAGFARMLRDALQAAIDEARAEIERAVALTRSARERALLRDRAAAVASCGQGRP